MRTRTRARRGAVVALTASALFLTAACGGSSEKDDKAKGGDSAGQKPAAAQLTEAQMKAGLLEVADLPAGWKAEAAASSDQAPKAEKPECQPLAVLMSDKVDGATQGGSREFARGTDSAILAQQIFTYSDGDAAAAFVKSVDEAIGKCASFVSVDAGEKMTISTEKLTAPQVGEEAVALRMTMDIPQLGMKLESDVLVARQGAGMTRLAYVPMGEKPDHAAFEDLAKRGGDKFVKGAQS
ncbi:sensor domain-containing protein [Streptomyces thermolilacinus]|uniref:Uncharacterized protein n=1 Tax=Streptomyces thermolilacinus SPC6 TaxID=1306406 RepID=A0A1D3DVJ4_9ACTN|nr:sensor domain-containing protein [Streptomyces thermolilacinus]OEJ96352.1 hypothetical protein J116_019705 [Streptomyces thermolilacinus SPC6]